MLNSSFFIKIKDVKRFSLLDVRIDDLTPDQVQSELERMLKGPAFNHLATVNPEFLVEAQKNNSFKNILNHTQLNVCDGFGITFWTKILYKKNIPRLTGVELAKTLCAIAAQHGKSVYFIGGFGVAEKAAELMGQRYPDLKVAGAEDGDPQFLSKNIVQAKPDIILVAFGAPAQEGWIDQFKVDLKHTKIAVGVGGTFDFWTGKATRAPGFMQKAGLEWLWRLLTQPKTRAKRIWNAVVVFSYLVIKERIQGRP